MKEGFKICMVLCFVFLEGYSQNCEIKNLVFEGAGIRGIAYAGVIEELEKHGKLQQVSKVGGTSAGAITALMVSLGYSSQEIADIISSTEFRKFNDGRFMFVGGISRMKKRFGWYRGERFTEWISEIIERKTGNSELTFLELNEKGYKDLYITATCLNKQQLIVFSRENYPQMKVKDAVRISISIPLYFEAVFIDSIGKVYHRPDKTKKLDVVVDGGIVGNFPIFMFDGVESNAAIREVRIPNEQTIGFRIDSDLQIESDAHSRELVPVDILDLKDYVAALYVLVLENLNRNELTEADWARTISVSSVGINPRVRKLSKEQKEKLMESGRMYTSRFIHHHCKGL